MDNLNHIIGITLGIRYAKSFRIPDIAGEIVDSILYGRNSPFDPKVFPRIQENSARERTLYNPETTEYFRINTDDIIIGLTVDNDFDKKVSWFIDKIFPYLKNDIFPKYEIKNIKRIGIIFDHKISKQKEIEEAISVLTKKNLYEVDNVNISFSKKTASSEALYRKGVGDYKNVIYSFFEENEALLARLDYQYYYKPVVEDLRDCFGERVLNDAQGFLIGTYHKWIMDKNSHEEEKY